MSSRTNHHPGDSSSSSSSSSSSQLSGVSGDSWQLDADGVEAQLHRTDYARSLSATEMRSVLLLVSLRLADPSDPSDPTPATPFPGTCAGGASDHSLTAVRSHNPSAATSMPLPFILPELQRIVAEYAAPARMFVGVSPADEAEQPGALVGWRVERVQPDQLRHLLLQRRLDELRITPVSSGGDVVMLDEAAEEDRMEELKALSLYQLLDDQAEQPPSPSPLPIPQLPPLPPLPLLLPVQDLLHGMDGMAAEFLHFAEHHNLDAEAHAVILEPINDDEDNLFEPDPVPAAQHVMHEPPAAAAAAPVPAAHLAPPAQTTSIYPNLPFEYLIEVAGADRIYCRHADVEVDRHMRRLQLLVMQSANGPQQQHGVSPSPSSRPVRECHLLPYLRLLFVYAHHQADLPELPSSVLSLVSAYASEPVPYSFPFVFSFDRPSSQLPLRIEREDDFRHRLWPHISKYHPLHGTSTAERLFGPAADALSQCDDVDWMMTDGDDNAREMIEERKQSSTDHGVCALSPHPLRERESRRQQCLRALWSEHCAYERRSSNFVNFLRSASSPSTPVHFAWLLRGGAFDHVVEWQHVIKPLPPC